MKTVKTTIATMSLIVLSTPVWAADFDGKTNLLCTATEIYECDAAHGCRVLDAEDAYHLQHLNVDVKNKNISLAHLETGFSSAIERVETVEDKVVFQGIEAGTPDQGDGGGWTVTVDRRYGSMVFTMAGNGYSFNGFGGCVPAR